jgi:hypothetical protein
MGPDPFSMPGFGSQSAAQNSQALTQAVGQAAPLATQYHGILQGQAPEQVFNQPVAPKSGGVLSNLTHFIGGIGSDIGHLATGAASWLGTQAVHMVTAVPREAQGFSHAILDNQDINMLQAQTKQNSDTLNWLSSRYRSGQMTKAQYQVGLAELSKENNSLVDQQVSLQNRIKGDKSQAISATIDTASLLTTILTAGFGKAATTAITAEGLAPTEAKGAADYLVSKSAVPFMNNVEQGLNKLATNPELFAKLDPTAQRAFQTATAEVVAGNGGTMTGAQIARASAANLALKYPIYYNMLSTQGQQIYQKLDNKQYGSAVQQLAVNAAFLLAGGPIGQALKYGGKAIGGVAGATFGRTAFLDELSKGIGDGSPDGLYNAINAIKDPAERASTVQALSNVEATNLAAVAGKDNVAAAWRVLNGMSSYEGLSMNQFTHEEALTNMVNFAKAQQLVDAIGKSHGLGPITVGRVDARALEQISANLTSGSKFADAGGQYVKDADGVEVWQNVPSGQGAQATSETRLQLWESLKAASPSQAWANNENFDRQMKQLIMKHEDASSLDQAIRNIKASFNIKGFPQAEAQQLSKMGYIPIKPINLEAPFQEGAGKIASKFATNDDFFMRAVQPLPVLSGVGSLLTHLGLSPTAATSRSYQMFNQNLGDNLQKMEVVGNFYMKGENTSQTADNIIKKLSDYAHNPTKGLSINGKPAMPITDLRQMTTRDIVEALKVTHSDAQEVKGAILDSMLQVPLQVRGLGDKIVDLNYKLNPTAGRYARIQGGARFAWNPFFQAKLAYKTELLSQAEANGKFPTLAGTNSILATIFPDKYSQLDGIRDTLRDAGIFDKPAHYGEGLTGEAVNDVGVAGANLTHRLLPSQERSIAGMVGVQADRLNMSVEDFVRYNPQGVRDSVQMIAQYDRNSEFLNSAMARTLNLAFFPFRFEYKVGSVMARSLVRSSPMTQLAVINGLYRAHDWLNSTEGQVWYSQNSQVIGLFKYFTPIQTLAEVGNLLGGHPDSIGSFGELGGLPFGWIPQLLDAEGLTNFGGAYVSPSSGQTLPDYVPTTDKGKLVSAIQDLVGSLYTYPGSTAGLPSKTTLDRNIALGVTGASKKADFTQVTPQITQGQQDFAQAVQASQPNPAQLNSNQQQQMQTQAQAKSNHQPLPQPTGAPIQSGTQVPATANPATSLPGKQAAVAKTPKKKKSQFTPQLLPGQTSLGQL